MFKFKQIRLFSFIAIFSLFSFNQAPAFMGLGVMGNIVYYSVYAQYKCAETAWNVGTACYNLATVPEEVANTYQIYNEEISACNNPSTLLRIIMQKNSSYLPYLKALQIRINSLEAINHAAAKELLKKLKAIRTVILNDGGYLMELK